MARFPGSRLTPPRLCRQRKLPSSHTALEPEPPVTALRETLDRCHANWMAFGPPPEDGGVEVPADFAAYEAEYAAIRRFVGLMPVPQRGLLRLTGSEVKDFLNRLVTQDIAAMKGGDTRRSFLLSDKGRIVADLIIHHGDEDTWLEADRYDLPDVAQLLDAKLFGEDVAIEDWSDRKAGFQLHGPASTQLLTALGGDAAARPGAMPGTHHVVDLGGVTASVFRHEPCGVLGFGLWCECEDAAGLWDKLIDAAGYDPEAEVDADFAEQRREGLRGRPVGWEAFNTARIEAGTPLFHIDFGPDSLPGETGLLDDTVSFTKGCYLGQEIVARMQNLGHPKRLTVGFKVKSDALPVAGTQVLEAGASDEPARDPAGAKVIGGVTSSTASPLLGHAPIGLAVMKWGKHTPGTTANVAVDGELHEIEICEPGWL